MTREIQFPATVPEYADLWGVTRQTIHQWIRNGELTSVKIGNVRRILDTDHQRFLKHLQRQRRPA